MFPDDLEREDRMTTAEVDLQPPPRHGQQERLSARAVPRHRRLQRASRMARGRHARHRPLGVPQARHLQLEGAPLGQLRPQAGRTSPSSSEAFVEGALSADKLVELTRFATPDNERDALGWALDRSTAAVRDRADEETRINPADVKRAERYRSLTWSWDDDRTRLILQGSFPALEGAKITKALDRLADKIAASPEDIDPDDPATTIDAAAVPMRSRCWPRRRSPTMPTPTERPWFCTRRSTPHSMSRATP